MFANITKKAQNAFLCHFSKKGLNDFLNKSFFSSSFISDHKSKLYDLAEGSQNSLKVYFHCSCISHCVKEFIIHNVCSSPAVQAHHLLKHIFPTSSICSQQFPCLSPYPVRIWGFYHLYKTPKSDILPQTNEAPNLHMKFY